MSQTLGPNSLSAADMGGKHFIGMSGWSYPGWKTSFYPSKLKIKDELRYAASQVSSIEVNGTFYSLQRPHSFQAWYDQAPQGFIYSVKGGQYITHVRRLKEVQRATANFFAQGILCLKEKLGPILWQFPPHVMLKDDRFEKFMKLLPKNFGEAARLAKKYTQKLEGRAFTEIPKGESKRPIRHAFEMRHPSFLDEKFFELLRSQNAALVMAHSGRSKWPYTEDITADFIYMRLHGEDSRFANGYRAADLKGWAKKIESWNAGKDPGSLSQLIRSKKKIKGKKGRDVFVYFDNKAKEFAPKNALQLMKLLDRP